MMDDAEKEIQEILKKHGLKMNYEMSFPVYKILPDEVQLALKIIEKHGVRIRIVLEKKA